MGGDYNSDYGKDRAAVSIHAPRVGGDGAWGNRLHALDISCHNCELTLPSDLLKNAADLLEKHLSENMPVSGCADLTANLCSLGVRVRSAPALQAEWSQDEWTFRVLGYFCAHVLNPPLPFGP